MARPRKLTPEEAKHRQTVAQMKWRRENMEYMNIGLPKGKRELYRRLAEAHNTNVSAMVQDYMDKCYFMAFGRKIEDDMVVK